METQASARENSGCASAPNFVRFLAEHGFSPLVRRETTTLQVNVGKVCNQACRHCHVDAGPKRTESMEKRTAERVIEVVAHSKSVTTVDITGGAPELNPNFPFLVREARRLNRHVMVRCNLTVLFEDGMDWLPEFYRQNEVELTCSLPCYGKENVDAQRGKGVFEKSIRALRLLNSIGYGRGDGKLKLNLVYNPIGAFLPPPQKELEARYKDELWRNFGIEFDRLFTLTNMPINRFANQLRSWGKEQEYLRLLVERFNPATVDGLMCRSLVSVGYDGKLYDCDFNQMLEMALRHWDGRPLTIWDINDVSELNGNQIMTARHCFGCTAGAGSSCGGALA